MTALSNTKTARLEQSCFELTFTADVALFNMSDSHNPSVLLVKRGMHTNLEPGKWALPGGHIDPEDGADTGFSAARELREETGIDVYQTPYPIYLHYWNYFQKPTWIGHVFWGVAGAHNNLNISPQEGEIQETEWVLLSNLKKYDIAFEHDKLIQTIFTAIFKHSF